MAARTTSSGEEKAELIEVVPDLAWWTFVVVAVGVFSAAIAACLVSVDVTCVGRGRLMDPEGTVSLRAPADAHVEAILIESGRHAEAESVVVRLRSIPMEATAARTARQRELAEQRLERRLATYGNTQEAIEATFKQRIELTRLSISEQRRSEKLVKERASTEALLAREGLMPALDAKQAQLELRRQAQSLLTVRGDDLALRANLLDRQLEAQRLLDDAASELENAKADEAAAKAALEQLVVRAPFSGRVEGAYVKAGVFVAAGTELAKLTPVGKPTLMVAYVAEADRAFLKQDAMVRIEPDQLPSGEFGRLEGRVKRVAAELATPAEVQNELGSAQDARALYRVEAELRPSSSELQPLLSSGMLVSARFGLRERRLASLIVAPLRKILEP